MAVQSVRIADIRSAVDMSKSNFWPRMQFRFFGVTGNGVLIADATQLQDINTWAKSRGIVTSGLHPIGERPVPPYVESSYLHDVEYVLQKDVDTFFD